MTLTLFHGPLSGKPVEARNYQIDSPAHRLLFEDFPRRVRAIFERETVLDTTRGKFLHETGLLPQLYVPRDDIRWQSLEATAHTTHCPFKGDAAYWSLHTGERVAENAAWAYPQPREGAPWLREYVAFYWGAMDAWLDEDEEVQGHLRDPYHRVDVRQSRRRVRVLAKGQPVAETNQAKVLSETGFPNRFYVPPDAVRWDLLEPSATHTICPYKGVASYLSVRLDDGLIADAAWVYPDPLEESLKVRDHLCFLAEGVSVEVDGQRAQGG